MRVLGVDPGSDKACLRQIICERHYTRSWPSGKTSIHTHDGAIVLFSIPANYNTAGWLGCPNGRVWELTRLWAEDGHEKNLLTQALSIAVNEFRRLNLADAVVAYADPNAGHRGGVYRAASWVYLGQSEENRVYRLGDQVLPRRKFHSGHSFIRKAEILALGFTEHKLPGKHRFARGLTRAGKRAVEQRLVAELTAIGLL